MSVVILTRNKFPPLLFNALKESERFVSSSSNLFFLGDELRKTQYGDYSIEKELQLVDVELSPETVTDSDRVSDEWVSLIAKDSQRYASSVGVQTNDLEGWRRESELLAANIFRGEEFLLTIDSCSIYAVLYAQTRYVAYCTDLTFELINSDGAVAALLIYALRHATVAIAENSAVLGSLKGMNVDACLLSDVDWKSVSSKLKSYKKEDLTPFDSLKQKRCEITYEAQYGDIYDSKYHDAVCYHLMDEYLASIVDDAVASRSSLDRKVRILDLGCGPGSMVSHLMRYDNWDYYGVDISQTMVDVAKRRYSDYRFQVGDAENLDFPDEHFDLVLCSGMLHHFPNLENVIVEVRRILKPDGCMISREPNENNFTELHPSLGFLHICLKSIVHIVNGTSPIVEPEEHDYHTDFDFMSMPETFGKYLWVDGFYTNQKISYFYDMIMDPSYRTVIEKMEGSLDGQPGLNIVAVARKTGRSGVSLAVRERIQQLDSTPLGKIREHLLSVFELYDRYVSNAEVPRFEISSLAFDDFSSAFNVSSSAVLIQGSSSEHVPCRSEQKAPVLLNMSDLPEFEELALYDHIKIVCTEDISARTLISQIERCVDYGVIELVVYPGVSIVDLGDREMSSLSGLSPLDIQYPVSSADSNDTKPIWYYLSRNLFTRKNFVEALSNVIEQFSLSGDLEVKAWVERVQLSVESEYKISLQSGSFYEFLNKSKSNL
ncbi:MAG: class I SAM-dependent methyltransferase [Cellvibrionaceae bacterium]